MKTPTFFNFGIWFFSFGKVSLKDFFQEEIPGAAHEAFTFFFAGETPVYLGCTGFLHFSQKISISLNDLVDCWKPFDNFLNEENGDLRFYVAIATKKNKERATLVIFFLTLPHLIRPFPFKGGSSTMHNKKIF